MSAYPVTDHPYPPVYARRFDTAALAADAVVVHADAANGGSAPNDVNHLPAELVVEVDTADQVLEYTDVTDEALTMTFPAVGLHRLRLAAKTIGGSAASTVVAVTVLWSQKG